MNMEAIKAEAKHLLNEFYQISNPQALPTQRPWMEWQAENKLGFFLGMIEHGMAPDSQITRLHDLLATNQFAEQQTFSTKVQLADPKHRRSFIDDLFAYYITPFHRDYHDSSSCHTPVSATPPLSRNSNSAEDLTNVQVPQVQRMSTRDEFRSAVARRDVVCVFCWDTLTRNLQAAHIIARKNLPFMYGESSILQRAGLTEINQVQNGLLLCSICHKQFDKLKRYVDIVDNQMVVKLINESDDPTSEKHAAWVEIMDDLLSDRRRRLSRCSDERVAVESNGEMALYFTGDYRPIAPNTEALAFHKAACLIWRMAGGAESTDEYSSDDDDDDDDGYIPVDYQSKCQSIEQWMDSSATLVTENIQ